MNKLAPIRRRVRLDWLLVGILLASGVTMARAAGPSEGVALMLVCDTSGSMLQKVRDAQGQLTPKHVIADRAIRAVLDRLTVAAAGSDAPPIQVGLVSFQGDVAQQVVRLKPFNPQPFLAWLKDGNNPRAGTPLGEAVRVAKDAAARRESELDEELRNAGKAEPEGPPPAA